jgi:membrane protease YdiL (CAAX protease family)
MGSFLNTFSEGDRRQSSRVYRFINQRPLVTAVIVFGLDALAAVVLQLVARNTLPSLAPEFVALIVLVVITLLAVAFLRWWRTIGYNEPTVWRDLNVLILPAIVVVAFPLLGGLKALDWSTVLYLAAGYLLTGIHEETIHRGIILRTLRPFGPFRAALISAFLFAISHLANLFVRANPTIVIAQVIGAFCDGFGFAALRLRTNTLWFLVILHALHDLLLQYTQLPLIPLDVVQVTILLIYGFIIMRDKRKLTASDVPTAPIQQAQ